MNSSPADVQPAKVNDKSVLATGATKKTKVKEPVLPRNEEEEAVIRDMMAKKQELLRLEQQKLELQLAEARASLEQQAKKLAAQQAVQVCCFSQWA
jgi:hypothetical protein